MIIATIDLREGYIVHGYTYVNVYGDQFQKTPGIGEDVVCLDNDTNETYAARVSRLSKVNGTDIVTLRLENDV